jgi:hypothetical protein
MAATAASLFSLNAAIKAARRLAQIGSPDVLLDRKKLIHRALFFAVLFVCIATLIGGSIGANGAETSRLLSDVDQMARLGGLISKARNEAERTVDAQIDMYKSIEPEVEELTSVLQRLQKEYAIYDGKFPAQHANIAKALDSVRIGIARMDLLREQISMAKLIASLDADTQLDTWETRMEPILQREDNLNSAK